MCESDKAEVKAFAGHTPFEAIKHSVDLSFNSTVFYYDGKPVGIFGLATSDYEGTQGSPWLLSTGKVDDFKYRFLKVSKDTVAGFLRPFERLVITVHSKNERSLGWLRNLGFKTENSIKLNSEVFYTMALLNKDY